MNRVTCGTSLLLLALAAGCSDNLPGKPRKEDQPKPADQIDDFATLYQTNCAACHGKDGNKGPAPPLNDPLFLAIISEKEIRDTLIEGRHGTAMASFAASPKPPETDPAQVPAIAATPLALTPKQIDILAEGIKKNWKAAPKTEGLPPYSIRGRKGTVARGKEAFKRACSMCHGEDGKEKSLAIHEPNFLALISEQALRRIVITGRPDLGMPSYREGKERGNDFKPLSDEEIDGLQALLASWQQGSTEP